MKLMFAMVLSVLAMAACSSTPHQPEADRTTASEQDRSGMPPGAQGLPVRPSHGGMPPGAQGMPVQPPRPPGMPPGAVGMPVAPPSMNACVRVSGEAALNRAYEANDGSEQCMVDEVTPKASQRIYEVAVSCEGGQSYNVTVRTKATPRGCKVAGHPSLR